MHSKRFTHPLLGRPDHSIFSDKIDAKPKEYPDLPFHRTIFRYRYADWDGFRSMAEAPLSKFFKHVSKTAVHNSDGILSGMKTKKLQ